MKFPVCAALSAALVLAACSPASSAPAEKPVMRILSPAADARLPAGKVKTDVDVRGYTLVAANALVKTGEGHLHFFIDVPASSVPAGQAVPLDQPKTYVHAGKAPYTSREIELTPGEHTIKVVMADAAHVVVAEPESVSLTVLVE
jgi:Domain of unknown function (DUF4399)